MSKVIMVGGIGNFKSSVSAWQVFSEKLGKTTTQDTTNVYWQQDVQSHQEYLSHMFWYLPFHSPRKFCIEALGDVVAYTTSPKVYRDIHYRIKYQRKEFGTSPVLWVAHSLGGIIVSDFLWDNPEYCQTDRLITLGSPFVLWTQRFPNYGSPIKPLSWTNVWSAYDPLSTPIKQLSVEYEQAVNDYRIRGFPFLAHIQYWKSKQVIRLVKSQLNLMDKFEC